MGERQGLYTQGKDDAGLTRREREVKALVVDEGRSQLEAADVLGISRQRVRQIVENLQGKGIDVPGAKAPLS